MNSKTKKKLVLFLIILLSGVPTVYYISSMAYRGVIACLTYSIPVESLFGEYSGVHTSFYKHPNEPIGTHGLLLKKDYTYRYELRSPDKEPFIFYGAWEYEKESRTIYLEDFYGRVSPFDYGFVKNGNEKGIQGLSAYYTRWGKIELDMDEELQMTKVSDRCDDVGYLQDLPLTKD